MTAKDFLESIRKIAGAVVVFVVLPAGAIANSQWWLAAVIALVGIFLGGRALLPVLRERRATAIARAEELTYRANQQNRWARRGDSRGVYGPAGAEIMRTIQPKLPKMPSPEIQPDVQIAAIADKPEGLAKMIAERTPGWRWAAFASVLVQRRAALRPRLRDLQLGFATPSGARARSGAEVARF